MLEDRIDRIDDYLSSEDSPEGCMLLSDLDGFIHGLLCSPETVPAIVWLNHSLGGNLDTVPDAVINDITDHYLGVAKVLSGLNPSPEPIFWEDGEGNAIAMDWCEGFMDAMKLAPETWLKLSNSPDHGHLMAPILAHLFDDHGNSLLGIPNDQLNKLLDEASIKIPDAIVGIHRFWRKQIRVYNIKGLLDVLGPEQQSSPIYTSGQRFYIQYDLQQS